MLKSYFLFSLLFLFKCANAHNPQVSTISFLEDQNNKWSVFITAPLYTFQLALTANNPNLEIEKLDPIAMQNEISKLLKSNLILNNDLGLRLGNEKIRLGHETTIYYTINNTAGDFDIKSLSFKSFDKLKEHFILLKIVPSQSTEIQFILNSDNKYMYSDNEKKIDTPSSMRVYVLLTLSMLIIAGLFYYVFKEKAIIKSKSPPSA